MKLSVGDKVFYAGRGPCLVAAVVDKVVGGTAARFYRLALLDDSGAEILVPVGMTRAVPIRALLGRSEIPKLLNHLKAGRTTAEDVESPRDRRLRNLEHLKLFDSGSVYELARLVESLTKLAGTKALTFDERAALNRARKLVIGEVAAVLDESQSAAEARVDGALGARKGAAHPVAISG